MDAGKNIETFDSVVRDICQLTGDNDYVNYVMVARAVRRAIHDLKLNMNPSITWEKATIDGQYNAAVPANAAKVTKVGKMTGTGRLRLFGRLERIYDNRNTVTAEEGCTCNTVTTEPNEVEATPTQHCPGCTFCSIYGNHYRKMFGFKIKGFPNGMYAVSEDGLQLNFTSGFDVYDGSEIVIEYAMAIQSEAFTAIPYEAFETIYYYTLTKIGPANERIYNFERYKKEYFRYKNLNTDYTAQDIIRALRSGLAPASLR